MKTLKQLANGGSKDPGVPWIGWGIIGALWLVLLMVMATLWNSQDAKIAETNVKIASYQVDLRRIELEMQSQKGRMDSQAIQVSTALAGFDRISNSLQSIEGRLIKMEVEQQLRKAR